MVEAFAFQTQAAGNEATRPGAGGADEPEAEEDAESLTRLGRYSIESQLYHNNA